MDVSDDTAQDHDFTTQALYNVLKNRHSDHIENVHVIAADGAGAFTTSDLKATMPYMYKWTGVYVSTFRITIVSDGKTNVNEKFVKCYSMICETLNHIVLY